MVAAFAILAFANSVSAQSTIRDLGTLGGSYGIAYDVSNRGQVVGYSQNTAGDYHAFSFAGGTMMDLGTVGGTFSAAYAVNDAGQVVGQSETAAGENHAFVWSRSAGMKDLGTFPGQSWSLAEDINKGGRIAGEAVVGLDPYGFPITHAVLWSGRLMRDLGTLGGRDSAGLGINDGGVVVGTSLVPPDSNGNVQTHAFMWTASAGMVDLGVLGGTAGSIAYAIDNNGDVVGQSSTSQTFPGGGCCEIHGFRWTQGGGMQDLGVLGGHFSGARAISSDGVIVGLFETSSGDIHGAVWSNGTMADLGALENGFFSDAEGINDQGVVAGGSCAVNCTVVHAVLWTLTDA